MAVLNLYTAEQARQLDRIAIEQAGLPGILLMKRAAFAAFQILRQIWPDARRIHVVCGTGNNGGDGFALAQYALLAGLEVEIFQVGPTHRIRGDALTMLHELSDLGEGGLPLDAERLHTADVIVDALFGTGLDRPVTGAFADAIEAIRASGRPVLALDVPSGLHSDSGRILGTAVRADHTVTFIGHKIGLHMEAGRTLAGQVHLAELGVPPSVFEACPPAAQGLTWDACPRPERPAHAHKGTCGTALLMGGLPPFSGALILAAEAALHGGAGLVHAVTDETSRPPLLSRQPAIMVHAALERERLQQAHAIGIGPGLGQTALSRQWLQQVLQQARCPLVLDADALNLLAQTPTRREDWILTPHPGEAARLLGCTTADVQADRLHAARQLQQRYGGVIVLKGAGTLIQTATQTWLCRHGNAGMASGGMGDVLTGLITALLAQGLEPADAACSGVCLHARAADEAASRLGQYGLSADQLTPFIQRLLG